MADNMTPEEIQAFLASVQQTDDPQKKVRRVSFPELKPYAVPEKPHDFHEIHDVKVNLSIELGRTNLTIREVLALEKGSIFELKKVAGEPVDVYVNDNYFGYGEIVVINEVLGIRVNQIYSDDE